ncbi:MAG: hypothetical protein SVT56_06460 [Chloroflexota bacterium]|jgi:hypothetical protein|nr:hypothetical protein [Chloroflexota bacterium]
MKIKRLSIFLLTLLLVLSLFGCANSQQEDVKDTPSDPGSESYEVTEEETISSEEETISEEDPDNGNLFEENFDGYPAAESVLPEPWLAYPDSIVDIDWVERGLSEFPAWTLVAPDGTTREDVVNYYISVAEQRDDFETIETYHGIAGVWSWNDIEIVIEPDVHYDYSELTQIQIWFEEDYQ